MPASRTITVRSVGLAALLALALGLRLWYASEDPSAKRFYDERFAIENIVAIVDSGSLEPANGYHPALSFLPATAAIGAAQLLHRTVGWPAESPVAGGGLSATGYLTGRALHALLGALAVWLTVTLGGRMFSAAVGWLAGLMVAAAPLHIRQSSMINEDVILAVTVLLAAHATLSALEAPSARRFLLAGGAFGLALASKFNGGVFSLPLAGMALWRGRRDRRQLAGLCLAAAASVAVFLVLNPYLPARLDLYRKDFGHTALNYDQRGAQLGSWHVVVHAAQTMARSDFLGPVLGYLGLAALLAVALLAHRRLPPEREAWFVLTAFPAVYVAALAIPAVHVSGHQWLPLLPFWAIAASQALCWAALRLPRRWAPLLATTLAAALAWRGLLFVRNAVVEMPADCVARFLVDELAPGPAIALSEQPLRGIRRHLLRGVVAVTEVEDLSALPEARRQGADGVVFPSRRRSEPSYRDWLVGARTLICSPGALAHGEELLAAVKPYLSAAPVAIPLAGLHPDIYSATVASDQAGPVSFLLTVPRDAGKERISELRVEGYPARLIWLRTVRERDLYVSERQILGTGARSVRLQLSPPSTAGGGRRQPQLKLVRWKFPNPTTGPAAD